MRKLKLITIVPYLMVVLAIFVALNPLWLQSFPRLELYQGTLAFSGERALENLQTLATLFPDRAAGSANSQASAQWMADQFRILGLETSLELFETFVPDNLWRPDFLFQPIAQTHRQITGTNVLAFSRGKSPSVVLVMAHRDEPLYPEREAESSASASAVLLEMARVLANGDHYYSYLFVSTDAAESSRQGARFLEQFHPDLSLRLAVSIDNVASAGAQTIGLFNSGSSKQATPLWTVALAQQVLKAQNLPAAYFNAFPYESDSLFPDHPLLLLLSLFNQRGMGIYTTSDSQVFLDRGDAVLGIQAVKRQSTLPEDPAGRSRKDTLLMAGQFIETYVRSLELNRFDSALLSRIYVIWQGQYLPALSVQCFTGLLMAAYAFLVVLPFAVPAVSWPAFANFLRREANWLFEVGLLAVLSGSVWLLPSLSFFRGFSPLVFLALMVILLVAGGGRLVRKRLYALRLWHFEPTIANQRRLLVLALLFLYVAYDLLFSPIVAASLMFVPFLLWSVVRIRSVKSRQVWLLVFTLWTFLHGLLSSFTLNAALSRVPPWSMAGLFTFMINCAVWLVILVYVFSTPPLGVIERR